MPIEKLYPKFTLTEDKLEELKLILPEAFADGKINWESLRESLGEYLEEDEQDSEHFGLFWPGKRDSKKLAATPSAGTLFPAKGEGINEENTKNIFIEGENLEVLKILQKSYANSIKMMYFDPPYNTGNDFIYDDNFTETIDEYLRRTGQLDEEGKPMTTNKKSDGRFHSKWLSMMYPRLKLSRNLLRDDGVIFISIDDNEVQNLREIMNEIYGEENFIDCICWKNKYGAGAKTKGFISVHEYILCYSKNPLSNIESTLSEEDKNKYDGKDEKFSVRGGFVTQPLMTTSLGFRENLRYKLNYNGEVIEPINQWVWEESRLLKAIVDNEVIIKKIDDGKFSVRSKQYLKDENGIVRKGKPLTILLGPYNQEGTAEIKDLLGKEIFPFPKPSELIKYFFSFRINEKDEMNGIYLDIFAGSGTSAHAVLDINNDGGNRKFILVQMPEKTDEKTEAYKAGYKNIAEICKERIRRVLKKNDSENNENNSDRGFKVFKLNKSNYKGWQNYEGEDISKLESLFESFESPLVDNWKKENLTNEIVLLEGFPLDSTIEELKKFKDNEISIVTSDFHEHKLLICLDKKIKKGTIENLDLNDIDIFICMDSAINDEEKMTLSDKGLIKTI